MTDKKAKTIKIIYSHYLTVTVTEAFADPALLVAVMV